MLFFDAYVLALAVFGATVLAAPKQPRAGPPSVEAKPGTYIGYSFLRTDAFKGIPFAFTALGKVAFAATRAHKGTLWYHQDPQGPMGLSPGRCFRCICCSSHGVDDT